MSIGEIIGDYTEDRVYFPYNDKNIKITFTFADRIFLSFILGIILSACGTSIFILLPRIFMLVVTYGMPFLILFGIPLCYVMLYNIT